MRTGKLNREKSERRRTLINSDIKCISYSKVNNSRKVVVRPENRNKRSLLFTFEKYKAEV